MSPALRSGMVAAAVGGAGGIIAGIHGEREGRMGRMAVGLAHGAVLGTSIMRAGGIKSAIRTPGVLRRHMAGAALGAGYSLFSGGSMGTGALLGGIGGQALGYGIHRARYGKDSAARQYSALAGTLSGLGRSTRGGWLEAGAEAPTFDRIAGAARGLWEGESNWIGVGPASRRGMGSRGGLRRYLSNYRSP